MASETASWGIIMLPPAYIQQLVAIAAEADAAGHGKKDSIYQRACAELGKSRATLLRHLKSVSVTKPRKRRADADNPALDRTEADLLSAYGLEGFRKNNRKITSLTETIEVLRQNGLVRAERLDTKTGELVPLSDSAISRALSVYQVHPEQLRRPTPHTRLQSKHPNHVWQVDGSVCVIYYLPDGGSELVELDDAVHYKNKPENLKAIEQFRVIRYVLTDHASGLLRYRYYPHAESGEHTIRFLAWAMAAKGGNDPFHGAPAIIMVDPGATSGGLVQRFCNRMGIQLIINKRRNPRAKGSVEKGNHLVETSFEQALRYMKQRPSDFNTLNDFAQAYQLWWNATKVHSRHNKTRLDVWMTISTEQLRSTPGADILLQLATEEPIKRQVQGDLTVQYKNRIWDVSEVPGVYVKSDVFVHWHPFMVDTVMAVVWDADGKERHIALPEIKKTEFGFYDSSATIGEAHSAKPDTGVDTNRKRIQQIAAGTATLADTEKKRSGTHYTPFDGAIDPLAASKQELPTYLHKQGRPGGMAEPVVELLRMNAVQMAKWLSGRLREEWQPSMLADLQKRFPDGATEPELERVLLDLRAGRTVGGKARLQAV